MARAVEEALRGVPEVADTFIPQEADYPTLRVKVDRVKAARLGLNQHDVVTNVITALTSNQMIAPSIWIDPKSGNDYFLTAQYFETEINSLETLLNIPVSVAPARHAREDALTLRDVATIVPERPSRRSRPLQHPARGRRAGCAAHPGPGRHAARGDRGA